MLINNTAMFLSMMQFPSNFKLALAHLPLTPSRLQGVELDGKMLSRLVEAYVGSWRTHGSMHVCSSWTLVQRAKCGDALLRAVEVRATLVPSLLTIHHQTIHIHLSHAYSYKLHFAFSGASHNGCLPSAQPYFVHMNKTRPRPPECFRLWPIFLS
jgi:hypothetical protein